MTSTECAVVPGRGANPEPRDSGSGAPARAVRVPSAPARNDHYRWRRSHLNDRSFRSHQTGRDDDRSAFPRSRASLARDRPHRLPDRRRSLRDAGDPALVDAALRRHPCSDGLCRQCQHLRHGGRRSRRRLLQPAYRPADRHPAQPDASCDSHQPAGVRVRSCRLHRLAGRAGPVHGVRFRTHPRPSRRAMQRHGCRQRVCRLHHGQCRQQSRRPGGLGGGCRWPWPCLELLFLRGAQSCRRVAGLFHHPARAADACDDAGGFALLRHHRTLARSAAARRFRHRLLHPVRVHRHLHLRQFRSGPAAAVARHDGSGPRLFGFSCRPSSRRCWPARRSGGWERGPRSGARSLSPGWACP
ncbi:hypothetical protein ABIA42_001272 [Bradyrhizobium sp. USDA 327]